MLHSLSQFCIKSANILLRKALHSKLCSGIWQTMIHQYLARFATLPMRLPRTLILSPIWPSV